MALWQLSTSALPQIDPIGGFKDGLVVGNFLQEKKAAQAEFVRKQQQRNTLSDLLKTNTGADGQVNMGAVRYGMAQAGYGDQIPDIQKAWLDNDKTGSEISKNTAEAGKNQQATRDAVRGNLLNMVRSANNPAVVGLVLNSAPARGAFSAEELQALMSGMPVDQGSVDYGQRFGQWQNGITQANTSPDTWMTQQTSLTNNALDNETQRRGQDVTAGTAQRGQDMTAQTAANAQTNQAAIAAANNIAAGQRAQVTANAAKARAELNNQMRLAKPETPELRMDRQINANKAAAAAQQGALAAQAAAALIKHPGITSGTGWSHFASIVPGSAAKDFAAQVETLKAQVFMPAIQQMKGMGALSNTEGARVEAAISNLDTSQSTEQFKKSLEVIAQGMARLTELSRKEARIYASRGGVQPSFSATPQPVTQQPANGRPSLDLIFGK